MRVNIVVCSSEAAVAAATAAIAKATIIAVLCQISTMANSLLRIQPGLQWFAGATAAAAAAATSSS